MKIEILNDWRGEWHQLLIEGEVVHEGHDIPNSVWKKILTKHFGVEIEERDHSFLSEEEYAI